MDRFPDEETAMRWLECAVWGAKRCCGHCVGTRTSPTPNTRPMPYWCSDSSAATAVSIASMVRGPSVPAPARLRMARP